MRGGVGQLDQFAKQIFAEETEIATGGAVRFQELVELNLSEVRLDGMLLVRDAAAMVHLGAPWSEGGGLDEIVLEIKMPGDHLDMLAAQRTLLRRQARQVQRGEDGRAPWDGEQALWLVAPRVPKVLKRKRVLDQIAPGCYRVGPASFPFLWIAANELPLSDELIPFLIARSGSSLDEFCRWVAPRKPPAWMARMIEVLLMSVPVYDELTDQITAQDYDQIMRGRREHLARLREDVKRRVDEELREESLLVGRIVEARAGLRRVIAHRQLVASAEDDARIGACRDLATLHRWLDQALDAPNAAEALR